jgi:hypothetical protein
MRIGPLILVLGFLCLYACSPVTSVPAPGSTREGYPLDTTTGIQEVDRVLAAVAGGQADEFSSLLHHATVPCTTKDGLGGPPKCRDGEAEGTPVEGLPFISSEGVFRRKDDITGTFRLQEEALYAIYRVSGNALNEEYYPPGKYMVVFTPDENGDITILRIDEGGIVRVDTMFADSLKVVTERDASEVILPPKIR